MVDIRAQHSPKWVLLVEFRACKSGNLIDLQV